MVLTETVDRYPRFKDEIVPGRFERPKLRFLLQAGAFSERLERTRNTALPRLLKFCAVGIRLWSSKEAWVKKYSLNDCPCAGLCSFAAGRIR